MYETDRTKTLHSAASHSVSHSIQNREIMFSSFCCHYTHVLEVAVPVSLRLCHFSSLTVLAVWVGQQAQAGNHSRNLSQAEYSSSLGHHHPTTLQCWFLLTLSECAKRVLGEVTWQGWGSEKRWNIEWVTELGRTWWAWTRLWRTHRSHCCASAMCPLYWYCRTQSTEKTINKRTFFDMFYLSPMFSS